MTKFTKYIIREIFASFMFFVILLTGILWLGQGLRHIDLLTTDNVTFTTYSSYIILLLPKIINLTLPISLFLSILSSISRIRSDSELVVMWGAGISNNTILLKPVTIFTSFLFLVMMILNLYVTPYSLNEIRQKIIDIRSSGINTAILKERKFISPTDTLTIFLQEKIDNEITGLLIHDIKDNENPQTYIAQKGQFISDNSKKILRLFNGSIQILNKDDNRISEIAFETYDLDLMPYNKNESSHRYSDELLTMEIYDNLASSKFESFTYYERQQFAEINNRLISAIYIFCYAFIPLLAFNSIRKLNVNFLFPVFTVSSYAILIKVVEVSFENILIENNHLIYINYLLPLIISFSSILFLIFNKPKNYFKINALKT